jgi:hypothetical protein
VRLDFYFQVSAKQTQLATPAHSAGPGAPPITRARGRLPLRRQRSLIPVTTAGGFHLFPFRTQQLSLPAPMVLPGFPVGEWVVAGMMLRWTSEGLEETAETGGLERAGSDRRPPAGLTLRRRLDYPTGARARSSVGEHYLDMVGVASSILAAPIEPVAPCGSPDPSKSRMSAGARQPRCRTDGSCACPAGIDIMPRRSAFLQESAHPCPIPGALPHRPRRGDPPGARWLPRHGRTAGRASNCRKGEAYR